MANIEPALCRGEVFKENDNQVLGAWDNLDGIDTPLERLADHAGISLEQSAAALDWMRSEDRESVFEAAAELVGKMFDALIPRRNPKSNFIKVSSAGLRLIAARVMLNRDGSQSLTQWAARARVSKQLLSAHLKVLERKTELHWLGGKRAECSATYAESARSRWAALSPEERKARRAGKAAQVEPAAPSDDQNLTGGDC